MKRIVVTAGGSPLGRRVVDALRKSPDTEHVRGIEARQRGGDRDDDLDIVSFAPDHRPFAEYLETERIDTLIQCGLVPDRSGLGSTTRQADVIGTMCLGASIGNGGSSIRSWIIASSSAVYPIGSDAALLQRERQELPREAGALAASIAEAERYGRDIALRMTHVNVAILRLQQVVGPRARGPLASVLGHKRVPVPIGYDPTIQLLHLDDAANALAFAVRTELAGVYNVASAGLINWHDAVKATGHRPFPVLPISAALLDPLFERLGIPFLPAELIGLLRYGHAVDTAKLERAGWQPQYDQVGCLKTLSGD